MRTIILILSFYFSFSFTPVYAQAPAVEWQKCFGGGEPDRAHSIVPTSDGGYIIAGYTESTEGDITTTKGTIDFWVVKISSGGVLQWQKNFGGRSWDRASVIHETTDGGYIVGGSAASMDGDLTGRSSANMDFWVVKITATGAIEWQKNYGGSLSEYLYDLKITADGYVLAGLSESTNGDLSKNNGLRDYWIVKISKTGVLQWQKSYGGSLEDEARSIDVTNDGGYIVTGFTESANGDVTGNHGQKDMWVLKLDGSGNIAWKKCLGGSRFEEGNAVRQTPDGGYILAGFASSGDGDVSGNHISVGLAFVDFWVVKLSPAGNIVWQKCYGGGFNEVAYSLDLTSDGGFLVAGMSESANGDVTCNRGFTDYWVIKINSSGILEWQKSLGAGSVEEVYSVKQTPDGGTILAGSTGYMGSTTVPGYHPNLHDVSGDFWIVKLTAELYTSPEPSVTISIPSTDVCAGSPYKFTAQAVASEIRSYQWYVNNTPVGGNNPIYSASSIRAGDVVRCVVTVAIDCNSRQVQSNIITMQGGQEITPEVVTTATATTICGGTSVTFTATNKSGNLSPSYQWTVDGQNVGTNGTVYTTNSLKNGAIVLCRMTVPHCNGSGGTKDDSDPIIMNVKPSLSPSIKIETANPTVCKNSAVSFSATILDGGTNPVYQWKVNGVDAGTNSRNFTINTLNDGDEVSCVLTADLSGACSAQSTVASGILKMNVVEDKPAAISIAASRNNVCEKTPIQFSAQVENGGAEPSFKWQVNGMETGENNSLFNTSNLKDGDNVSCVLTTKNICAANNTVSSNTVTMTIKEVPKIRMSTTDTTVAAGTQLQLTSNIEGDISSYEWSPRNYLTNSSTLHPLTIALEDDLTLKLVVTATNGCQSEEQVNIAVTNELFMPNSFSPNNDGRNDLFRIPPRTKLKLKRFVIFDRWGNVVFTTMNSAEGWDGTYKGQVIPGVYVYVVSGVTLKNDAVNLKGTVVLIK